MSTKRVAEDDNPTPKLIQAVLAKHLVKVKIILNNKHYDRNIRDWKDKTALHYACELGQHEVVKVLIQEGADIEAESNSFTPLSLAATHGYAKICKILIDAGASLETPTFFNANTALSWATLSGHAECVNILLKSGARYDVKTAMGCYPAELASPAHPEIAALFAQHAS